jgi:nucleotide-binding universal stress UspA family protein
MYTKILVPVDGSATSTRGLDEAIALAQFSHGKLRLIHVVDELSYFTGFEYGTVRTDIVQLMEEQGRKILQDGEARAVAAGVPVETAMFLNLDGRLSVVIEREAAAGRADLVVIGTHGRRGASRLLLGSDAEQVLRTSPVPVLLVRSAAPEAKP